MASLPPDDPITFERHGGFGGVILRTTFTPRELSEPDFKFRSLRGNAVLRWEYRPGSTLFFVWQQSRAGANDVGQFELWRDVGAIFHERPTNVFLVKVSYWFGS